MAETNTPKPGLIKLLLDMHSTSKSGVLRLKLGKVKKQIVVSEGLLAFAESSVQEEHLARIMIGMDLISRDQLPAITEAMKAGRTSDEAIFQSAGLSIQEINAGAQEQAITILASLFSWEDCELECYLGQGLAKRQLNIRAPMPQILVLAARRAAHEGTVPIWMKLFDRRICPGETKAFQDFPLDSAEVYVRSLIHKPTRFEDLLPLLPNGEARGREHIHLLLLLGLVHPEQFAATGQGGISGAMAIEDLPGRIAEMIARFEKANFYEILGVKQDVKEEALKEAYHALARQYHSDRFQSREYSDDLRITAGKLFTFITGAYTTLSDSVARSNYDAELRKEQAKVDGAARAAPTEKQDQKEMAEGLYRAARVAQQKGETDKAVRLLKECVWLSPDIAKYHHYLGIGLAESLRSLKEAEQHFQKAIELECSRAASYIELGKLYVKARLIRRAEAQFLKALEWEPENAEAARLLRRVGGGR
jgi:curved DNA-binding protein CbpA